MDNTRKAREGAPVKHSPKKNKRRRQRVVRLSLLAAAAVLVIAIISFTVFAFTYDKAFPNLVIGEIEVGGKTHEQIVAMMDEESRREYQDASFQITVPSAEVSKDVNAADFDVAINSTKAAEDAMQFGRDGSAWNKFVTMLSCLFREHEIASEVTINEEKLSQVVAEIAQANVEPTDAAYSVKENVLLLMPPKDGFKIDEEALKSQIREEFSTRTYQDITVEPQVAEAKRLNLDDVYAQVHKVAQDAKMQEVDGKHTITPHVIGVDFDLDAAKKELAEHPDEEITIALTLTTPKVTTIMLEATLFQDTLSEVETYFSPRKVERTSNVRLAAQYMNGTVLNPGEVFSFNDAVGPRTRARGFKEAQIFAAGEIVDGLGGGICQVSSTLYMAAMKADMKTVSRRNHSFYVDYAPKGQDATVVYGSIDFKFENTSPYPIKIVAVQRNNYIRVTIKGTKTQEKTVKITTKVLSTTPFTEKVVIDNTLKPGQRVITQAGQEGITMEAYRWVYDGNGKLIDSYLENKTKYVPLTQIVHVGPSAAGTSGNAGQTVTPSKPAETKPDTGTATDTTTTPETSETPAQPAENQKPADNQNETEGQQNQTGQPESPDSGEESAGTEAQPDTAEDTGQTNPQASDAGTAAA